jgi:uncharacterized membrane protein
MNHKIPSRLYRCQICGKKSTETELFPASLVGSALVNIIAKNFPDWSTEGFICTDDLDKIRNDYMNLILETEKGELSSLEKEVLESLSKHEILSAHIDQEYESALTFGERLSDKISVFGGSWRFIIIFGTVLLLWVLINSLILLIKPFDPYPYILLNLALSCLAAIQAPIIMMSQNRQEAKDRLRAAHDYQINLKAELEIRHLEQKVDHLLSSQWKHLVEIQELQLELMEEIRQKGPRQNKSGLP